MEVTSKDILIYETPDGRIPFEEWLEDLEFVVATRIRARIDRVALGNFGDSKSVGDGINELRIPFGPGFRVYFGLDGSKIVVLLLGGDKSTQSKDIELSKKYWIDYKRRSNG